MIGHCFVNQFDKVGDIAGLTQVVGVDTKMRNLITLGARRFGRPNVEAAIDCHGVSANDDGIV